MSDEQVNGEERAQQLEQELAAARAELEGERLARQIDAELRRAGATETEAAAALIRERVRDAKTLGKEVDLRGLVTEMRKSKGVLFGTSAKPASAPSGATGAAKTNRASVQAAAQAAAEAKESGDQRALLRYLKLRRGS